MMSDIIELIKHRITPMDSEHRDINITRTFHRDDYKSLDVVINSLDRGEKFEQMWVEFWDNEDNQATIIKMDKLELKYFPKEEKVNV